MVTVEGHEKLCRLVNACRQGADNTTPMPLVQEIIEKIPDEVWKDTSTTILDPAAGSGTFLVAAYWKMIQAGDTHENIISNRLFACEINLVYLKIIKDKLGIKNIYNKDFLQIDLDMKFDIIIGNPPYNSEKKTGRSNLYQKFVDKSCKLITSSGKILFITPQGWLNIGSADFKAYRENIIEGVKILSKSEANQFFPNVGSTFSYYIISNGALKGDTTLFHNCNSRVNLKGLDFLPKDLNKTSLNIFKKVFKDTPTAGFNRDYELGYYKVGDDKSELPNKVQKYKMYAGDKIQYTSMKHSKFSDIKVMISEAQRMYNSFVDKNCSPSQMTFYLVCDNIEYAENYSNLLNNTKTFRYISDMTNYGKAFILRVAKNLPHIPPSVRNDNELYSYFNLTQEEIGLIEATVE